MRIKELRKRGLDKDLKYFLVLLSIQSTFNPKTSIKRWIEYVGWVIDKPKPDMIVIHSPMGGQDTLVNALEFETRKECLFTKDKLNSEIVKEHEPENWIVTWKKTYDRTHKQSECNPDTG